MEIINPVGLLCGGLVLLAVIVYLLGRLRSKYNECSHEFDLGDLELTGLDKSPDRPPIDCAWEVWCSYLDECEKVGAHPRRVKWPCRICKEIFYAHCGLDISPKYGPTVKYTT